MAEVSACARNIRSNQAHTIHLAHVCDADAWSGVLPTMQGRVVLLLDWGSHFLLKQQLCKGTSVKLTSFPAYKASDCFFQVEFGFVPHHVVVDLQDIGNWKVSFMHSIHNVI